MITRRGFVSLVPAGILGAGMPAVVRGADKAPLDPTAIADRVRSFDGLHPGFAPFGWGSLKDAAKTAYNQASVKLLASLGAGDASAELRFGGLVTATARAMRHGTCQTSKARCRQLFR